MASLSKVLYTSSNQGNVMIEASITVLGMPIINAKVFSLFMLAIYRDIEVPGNL